MTHGLTAENPVLPGEDIDEYRQLVERLTDVFDPMGAMEEYLITRLAMLMRRAHRGDRIESGLLKAGILETEAERIRAENDLTEPTLVPADAERRARELEAQAREPAWAALANAFLRDVVGAGALEAVSRYQRDTWREMRQILILMPALQSSRPCDLVPVRVPHEGQEPEHDEDLARASGDKVWVTDAVKCQMSAVGRLVG